MREPAPPTCEATQWLTDVFNAAERSLYVPSTNLRGIVLCEGTGIWFVEFLNGSLYAYPFVPAPSSLFDQAEQLKNMGGSIYELYAQNVKNTEAIQIREPKMLTPTFWEVEEE